MRDVERPRRSGFPARLTSPRSTMLAIANIRNGMIIQTGDGNTLISNLP